MGVKVEQRRRLIRKKMIYLKYGARGEHCGYPGPPGRWTSGCQSEWSLKHHGKQKWRNWNRPTSATSREGRVLWKENDTGKNGRQQEKRRLNLRWTGSIKGAIGVGLQELSRAAGDRMCGPQASTSSPGVEADSTVCNKYSLNKLIFFLIVFVAGHWHLANREYLRI